VLQGVEIVRRRAGGGAVLVAPLAQVWIDVWIPRDDDLWDDDVVRSAWWLGQTWAAALASLGVKEPQVHRGPSISTELSRLVCFAGIGPGEVTVSGSKVVGIAQRRTRRGARFLSMAQLSWDPSHLVELLSPAFTEARQRSLACAELAPSAKGLRDVLPEPVPLDPRNLLSKVEQRVSRFLP